MANAVTVTLQGVDNLSNVITGAITKAGVLGAAFQGAMGLANKAIDSVVGGIKSAGDTQLDLIGLAGSMMGVLNVGYSESLSFSKALNSEFIKLGSQLPGTAEDFAMIGRSVADDVVRAFKDADEDFSMDNAQSELVSLTRTWGLLAQQTGTLASDAGQNLTRLIAGDRMVLKQVMFDKSPAFKAALNQILKTNDLTLKDWASLTTKQRVEWIKQAADMTIPEAAIQEMSATVSGTLAGWRSLLFDPSSGAFGFLRELPNRFGETALDAFYGLLKGFERMAKEVARLSPFDTDVMVLIFDGFTYIGSQFDKAAEWLKRFQTLSDFSVDPVDISQIVQSAINKLSGIVDSSVANLQSLDLGSVVGDALSFIGDLLRGSLSALPNLSNSLGSLVKSSLAAVTDVIAQAINFGISNLPAVTKGATVMFDGLFDGLMSYMVNDLPKALGSINWIGLTVSVVKSVLMVGWTVVKSLAKLAVYFNLAVVKSVFSIASNTPVLGSVIKGTISMFKAVGSAVGGFIGSVVDWVKRADDKLLKTSLNLDKSLISSVTRMEKRFARAFKSIGSGINSTLSKTIDLLKGLFSSLWKSVRTLWESMVNRVKSIDLGFITDYVLDGIKGLFNRVKNVISGIKIPNALSGVGSVIGGVTSGVTSRVSSVVGSGVSAVTNLFSGGSSNVVVGSGDPGLATQHIWGNSFGGNLKPLYDAIALEKRKMPSGSNLTIANTSEAILNQGQIGQLVNHINRPFRPTPLGVGRTVSNTTSRDTSISPNITVNINYSGDSGEELADIVINKLAEHYFSRKSY